MSSIPDDILKRLVAVHGSNIDFSNSTWNGWGKKIDAVCILHGVFSVYPGNAVKPDSKACRLCVALTRQNNRGRNVVEEFRSVHGDKYDYTKFVYNGMLKKSIITCPRHGDFSMTSGNHITGHGCASCTNNAPSKQEDAWISAIADKIGVTPERSVRIAGHNGTFDARFGNILVEFDGAYWHSRKDSYKKDFEKTAAGVRAGYKVLRLRASSSRWGLTSVLGASNVFVDERVTEDKLRVAVDTIERLLREQV